MDKITNRENIDATGYPNLREQIAMGFALSFPGRVLSALGEFATALDREKARERVVWLHAGIDDSKSEKGV